MVLVSAFCRTCRLITKVAVFLLVLALIPGIPPHVTFSSYEIVKERPLERVLAPNNILDYAERILEGKVEGPESIASRTDDEIFMGVHGGKVLRLQGKNFDQLETVIIMGAKCDKLWQTTCGRPLGMRFDPHGRLLVADSYLGLFSVNVDSGEKECLFNVTKEIDGISPKLLEDLDYDAEGNIYWSDASSVSGAFECFTEMISDPSGRLIKFNPKTKVNTVLVRNLHFATGVQVSPGSNFVLVSEAFRNRVLRHWLKGPKAGTTDIFVDRLPGMPGNIRKKNDGGYYVPLSMVKDHNSFDYHGFLAKMPLLRKLMARLLYLAQMMFDAISSVYPNDLTEIISFQIFNLNPVTKFLSGNKAIVVELDSEGNIVGSLQGDTGQMRFISEIKKVGDNLFFASLSNNWLGRLYVGMPTEEEWAQHENNIGNFERKTT